MSQTHILLSANLQQEHIATLQSIHPSVIVHGGPGGAAFEPPNEVEATELTYPQFKPGVDVDAILHDCQVVIAFKLPADILERAPDLRWIQFTHAGVDEFLTDRLRESQIAITNISGVHSISMAEMVLSMMLIFVKSWPAFMEQKRERVWRRHVPRDLQGKTLGIIGAGNIGRAVARTGKFMGMRVLAVKRHVTGAIEGIDQLFPPSQLTSVLSASDFLVLCVPLTHETYHMLGAEELRAMSSGSYLINVSRGEVVEQEALIRALSEGPIAGAALDVFREEPLPEESPLWDMPNVLITPHIAGDTTAYLDRMTDVIAQNVRRYVSDQPLINVVDPVLGY